jgi:hypothetical protein
MAVVTSAFIALSSYVRYGSASVSGASTLQQAIDDAFASPDDNTTVITLDATSSTVLFSFTAPSVPSSSVVNGVKVYYRHKKSTTQTCNIRSMLGVGSANYVTVDAGANPANGAWNTSGYNYTTNPKTGSPWLPAEINRTDGTNDLQFFGLYTSDASPRPTLTQVYVEINYNEYEPPPPPTNWAWATSSLAAVQWFGTGWMNVSFIVPTMTGTCNQIAVNINDPYLSSAIYGGIYDVAGNKLSFGSGALQGVSGWVSITCDNIDVTAGTKYRVGFQADINNAAGMFADTVVSGEDVINTFSSGLPLTLVVNGGTSIRGFGMYVTEPAAGDFQFFEPCLGQTFMRGQYRGGFRGM